MASNTFNNLPKEKKERIIKAAIKEFSRVPLDKALISNIIKDAGIPRGSFYQYFENIDDLFVYIIDGIFKNIRKEIVKIAQAEDKSFFEAMKKKFYEVLCYFENGENKQFNINIYMSFVNMHMNNSMLIKTLAELNLKNNLEVIPEDIKKMPHSEEFLGLVEMANLSCLNKFVFKEVSKEEVFEEYCSYLKYIKEAATNLYKGEK